VLPLCGAPTPIVVLLEKAERGGTSCAKTGTDRIAIANSTPAARILADILAQYTRFKSWKLLRQIPGIGPIRAAVLMAVMQTPHRFRTKRQLWNYSGLGLETHDSGE
jgi:transposase